jgi:glycosyltransferase involved in cell wall biosynthesis
VRICLASIHPRLLSGQIEGLVALGRELRALGHKVRVVAAFPEAVLYGDARWSTDSGDAGSLVPKVVRIGRILRDVCRAAREVDVVQLNLPTPAFGFVADVVQTLVPIPVVVGYEAQLCDLGEVVRHGHLWRSPGFFAPRVLINNGLVTRLTLRRGRRYVVASELQAAELRRLGVPAAKVSLIPTPIDTAKLQRWPRAAARQRLGLPAAAPLVAYVGHCHPVKGVELLPAALPRLRERVPDARLVLACSGIGGAREHRGLRRAIERAGVGAYVIEVGRVDVGLVMSAADVVAAPYTLSTGQAAFPAVPLEAMRLAVPLVTTDLPLMRELTASGQAGLLVPPTESEGLADGIARILGDSAAVAAMTAAQRRLTSGRYHPGRIALRYAGLYESVLDEAAVRADTRADTHAGGQARVLQPAFGQRQLRPAAVRWSEWAASRPAGTGDRRAAA